MLYAPWRDQSTVFRPHGANHGSNWRSPVAFSVNSRRAFLRAHGPLGGDAAFRIPHSELPRALLPPISAFGFKCFSLSVHSLTNASSKHPDGQASDLLVVDRKST